MITNALLERMHETAAFSDDENVKLQEFADLCVDIESQVAYLPGLACLNFPNAIQPIVEKLPPPPPLPTQKMGKGDCKAL